MRINLIKKILGFSIVGINVTLLSIVFLFLFLSLLKMNLYIGYILSYFLSISISYLLNSFFVFKTQKKTLKQVLAYFIIYIVSMFIGLIFLYILKSLIPNGDKFLLSLMIIPITFLWNFFFANKLLTNY